MADLTGKKALFLTNVVTAATLINQLTRIADELPAYYTDNGFAAGGTSPIVDADCTGPNAHLSAALVGSVTAVLTALSGAMTPARRATMRQAETNPLP
jgi:hypothetical protein